MPQIRVKLGHNEGLTVPLADREIIIGRDPASDVPLNRESPASRRHAAVFPSNGGWRIRDLGSVNGTLLNGVIVSESPLSAGDEITIGDSVFVFEEPAGAAPVAARVPADRGAEPVQSPEIQRLVQQMSQRTQLIMREIGKAIVGQREIVLDVLTAIISRGHVLLIGMPGLAKTTLVRTVADVLDLKFRRIQFTPDLMPSDITGTDILEVDDSTGKKEYRFIKGPIFSQILLADEINRTPPKTQAALLEAMQEYRVTAAGQTFPLEPPFFVLATQNPLEQEGTYPLPEAQLDRFMFSVYVDYPTEEEEEVIAKVTTGAQNYTLNKVLDARAIIELQNAVRDLPISDHVVKYAVRLARATRPGDARAPEFIKKWIHCGAGPRAAQYLLLAAKARAVIDGRLLVTTDDVRRIARSVLRHRTFTNFTADSEGMDTDKIVQKLIEAVPEPGEKDY
jgi:MoxR-like ATPase